MIEESRDEKKSKGEEIIQNCLDYFIETNLRRLMGLLMVLITANKYSYFCGILLNHLIKVTKFLIFRKSE